MLRILLLSMLIASLALAGCAKKEEAGGSASGSTPSSTSKPDAPEGSGTASTTPNDGWKEVKSAGFSLHVPSDWTPLDLTASNLEAIIDEAAKANEGVKMQAAQFKQIAASGMVKLMVYGTVDPAGPFAENLNVVVMPAPQVPTSDQMVEEYKKQITPMAVPGSSQTGGPHKIPAGEAVKMRSELAMASGKATSVASLAYMVPTGGKMYTVTFSCLPGRAAEMEKLADEVMQTLKVD